MWQEPKTDWTTEDSWDWREYERWRLNIAYLANMTLTSLPRMPTALELGRSCVVKDGQNPADFSDTVLCYRGIADETVFNALEDSLQALAIAADIPDSFIKKVWYGNDWTPTDEDLNRWEKACLAIYQRMQRVHGIAPRINTYRLNGGNF